MLWQFHFPCNCTTQEDNVHTVMYVYFSHAQEIHRVTTQQLKSKGVRQIYWAFHLPRNITVETQNANENNLWMLYAAYQLQRHLDPPERNGVFLLGCFLSPFTIYPAYLHQTTIEL